MHHTVAPVALGDAALRYAARGRAVFPVRRDKSPLVGGGFKAATTDPDRIRGWWERWPEAGIATPLGGGLFVLDVDDLDALAALEADHGRLPATIQADTPRPGRHYFFRGDVRNGAGRLPAGIDVRGAGGYVVLPPSVHANGEPYRWRHIGVTKAARAPRWLLELLHQPTGRRPATPTSEWLRLLHEMPEGERNAGLARLAGHLLHRHVDEHVVLGLLHAVNRTACKPPLPNDEVERVAESILRRHLRKAA